MRDEYEYEDYDCEDYDNDDYKHNFPNIMNLRTLYFCQGAYKIITQNHLAIGSGEMLITYRIERTEYATDKSPSLLDIYEIFDNSYLLEFLMSVITPGCMNIRSCRKLINVNDSSACIICTASFNVNQKFVKIEDEVESDEKTSEVITISNAQFMRTHQMFSCVTQPAKYCTVKYDKIHGDNFDWTSNNVDWQLVYNNYVDPYIRMLMASHLKIMVEKDFQYKEYIDFNVQFCIERSPTCFYEEIYILPNSVLGRELIYNSDNGRQIMICNQKTGDIKITSDEFRVCMGTQNLSLLPIDNMKIYSTTENGKPYIVCHETSNPDDTLHNYFIISYHRFSLEPSESILWLTQIHGFDQCPYKVIVADNIEEYNNLKTNEEKKEFILNHTKSINSLIQFFGVSNSITDQLSVINVGSNGIILGVVCISLEEYIKPDALVYCIEENIDNPDGLYLPQGFYNSLSIKYKLSKNTKFTLIPIRALPKYREFMVLAVNHDSKNSETQSDIIEKTKDNMIEKSPKKHFFQSLFGK